MHWRQEENSDRFEAQEGSEAPLLAFKMERPCAKTGEQHSIAESNLRPIISKETGPQHYNHKELKSANSLEADFSLESPEKNPAQLIPWFWLCEILSRKHSWARSDFWPIELWANKEVLF